MNKFISETDIEKKKQQRQEEWEKVRKADDPIEAPEEVYDPRSLFDRLQEQKDKKQTEFEESIKFKNQFRGIDQDEANFLGQVAVRTADLEKQKKEEEKKELEEFRSAVRKSNLTEAKPVAVVAPTLNNSSQNQKKNLKSQSNLIKKGVKRKSAALSETSERVATCADDHSKVSKTTDSTSTTDACATMTSKVVYPSAQICAGILPGIGSYDSDSSESGSSTDVNLSSCLVSSIVSTNDNED